MKSSFRGAVWAAIALSPVAYLACTDDASIGFTSLNLPDGSVGPTIDAAPVVDAAAADAAEAGPTTVTVTAIKRSTKQPEADATIVFYAPDGGVLATAKTDAKGHATQEMPAKGAITAVFGSTSQPRLVSILEVEPGDALTALDDDGTTNGSIHFKVTPPATPFPGTVSRRLDFGTCSVAVNADGVSDEQSTTCITEGTGLSLSLVALDANAKPLASTTLADVTPKLDGSATDVTFANAWTAVGAGETVSVASMPKTNPTGVYYGLVAVSHELGIGTGRVRSRNALTVSLDAPATFASTFTKPLVGATFQQNEASFLELRTGPNATITRALAIRGPVTAAATFDVAALPARLEGVTVAGVGAPTLAITGPASLSATKGIVASVSWGIPDIGSGAWLVIAPASSTTFAAPALPPALASFAPSAATIYYDPLVMVVDGTLLPTYAATRAAGALLTPTPGLRNGSGEPIAPPLPVDGTLSISAFGPNID